VIVRGLALAVACVAIGGCGACNDDAKPAAKAPPRSANVPPASSGKGSVQVRTPTWKPPPGVGSGATLPGTPTAVGTAITVDEATPAIPAIAGATIIDAPTAAPAGGQVHFGWCIVAADQAAALAAVSDGLVSAGWSQPRDRGQGARVALTADKAPYRLTASISASPRPGCSPADGTWFASVAMYKVESVTRPPGLTSP
jgi:hypothetical protein